MQVRYQAALRPEAANYNKQPRLGETLLMINDGENGGKQRESAIQAENVLASPRAIEMGVHVVRAFVRLRELVVTHKELVSRLNNLEQTTEALALQHYYSTLTDGATIDTIKRWRQFKKSLNKCGKNQQMYGSPISRKFVSSTLENRAKRVPVTPLSRHPGLAIHG